MTYKTLKTHAVGVVDDFTDRDIVKGYFPPDGGARNYTGKTKLDAIQVTAPVRSVMPPRTNKVFAKLYGNKWSDVSAYETVKLKTIGEFITLCASHAGEKLPDGEPT